ncbi:hypothetical protein GCM10027093_08500 [Paraburkholderia jirisanensis]
MHLYDVFFNGVRVGEAWATGATAAIREFTGQSTVEEGYTARRADLAT